MCWPPLSHAHVIYYYPSCMSCSLFCPLNHCRMWHTHQRPNTNNMPPIQKLHCEQLEDWLSVHLRCAPLIASIIATICGDQRRHLFVYIFFLYLILLLDSCVTSIWRDNDIWHQFHHHTGIKKVYIFISTSFTLNLSSDCTFGLMRIQWTNRGNWDGSLLLFIKVSLNCVIKQKP